MRPVVLSYEGGEIDTAARELRCAGHKVAVEPKVFDLIVLLAQNHDRVVSRDEVIDKIWSGRIISDAALSTCIKAARRALGDDGRSQRLIRTVQRIGFRFVGNVAVFDDQTSLPVARTDKIATENQPSSLPDRDVNDQTLRLPDQPSIAVLPFESLSDGNGRSALADGLARDITTRLGRARWLFVIARGSSFQFRPSDAQAIGARLAVRYVLQGSVSTRGKRVRINVALIDTVSRNEVWADLFDRNFDDIFAIQDEISEAVVRRVQSEIEQTERRRALLKPLANLDAWSAYHRACWHMDRHTPEDYEQAEACFRLASEIDRGSARVFAGLSAVHRQRAFLDLTRDRNAEVQQALEMAQHSLSLDPNDPQARWALGRALMLRYEVEPALEEFETAAMLNPSFAMGQYSVGFGRAMIGKAEPSDQALTMARRLSPIDPMRFAMLATHAFNAAVAKDHERAADLAQLAAAQPTAHYHIIAIAALCNALAKRRTEAERYVKRLHALQPGYASADYFRVFPFKDISLVAMWQRGFKLLGISE